MRTLLPGTKKEARTIRFGALVQRINGKSPNDNGFGILTQGCNKKDHIHFVIITEYNSYIREIPNTEIMIEYPNSVIIQDRRLIGF